MVRVSGDPSLWRSLSLRHIGINLVIDWEITPCGETLQSLEINVGVYFLRILY